MHKLVEDLTDHDIQKHPVWKFSTTDVRGETAVVPIKKLPVSNLDGKIVGCYVAFANGMRIPAILGNISTENPKVTEHFITISIWNKKEWFHLARYFDPDRERNGPAALSENIGIKLQDIFPIAFDVRTYAKGVEGALAGKILDVPKEILSREERIKLRTYP